MYFGHYNTQDIAFREDLEDEREQIEQVLVVELFGDQTGRVVRDVGSECVEVDLGGEWGEEGGETRLESAALHLHEHLEQEAGDALVQRLVAIAEQRQRQLEQGVALVGSDLGDEELERQVG